MNWEQLLINAVLAALQALFAHFKAQPRTSLVYPEYAVKLENAINIVTEIKDGMNK